jgi:NAD(P)-dependent dehydrogenase (short-subunit alcohol dehydrogenase family)
MTEQAPLGSGFGARSTAAEVLAGRDLAGLRAVVTGGYSGLGLETTKALAAAGARVLVPARTRDKAQAALADVPGAEVLALDLIDPTSVAAAIAAIRGELTGLELLICNAAIMANPLTRDARGFESQFATNHFGHFQLVCGLWPLLRAAQGARVVMMSSIGHRISPVQFEDIHFAQRDYNKWVAYGQAKTANSLCALGIDARGKDHGIRAFAVHPGGIMTDLQRFLPMEEQIAMGWVDAEGRVNPLFKTPAQGAATSVWAGTHAILADHGGVYCEDCDIAAAVPDGDTGYTGVRRWAVDPEAADRLWSVSETALDVRLP